DAARARLAKTAGADARIRKAGTRYRGAHAADHLLVSHRAVSFLCQRLEDQPQPFRQSGPGDDLARPLKHSALVIRRLPKRGARNTSGMRGAAHCRFAESAEKPTDTGRIDLAAHWQLRTAARERKLVNRYRLSLASAIALLAAL